MIKKISFLVAFFWVFSVLSANYPPIVNGVVLSPKAFTIAPSDWTPIVVSGAGTAGANGNYYVSVTNAVSGLGYAVFTNSSGSAWRLVQNNTNIVPSSVLSNYWTLENTINVNFAYDILSEAPFGTWTVSSSGGTPGANPPPMVGVKLPDLILASSQNSGGFITLSPGYYDIGSFSWFPTNLCVVAHGATIVGKNAGDMVHPIGSFELYGGTISNYNLIGSLGGTTIQMTHLTNRMVIKGANLFGPTDCLFGQINSDNFHLDLTGNTIGGWWDTIVCGEAAGLTNVTANIVVNQFWNQTNTISTSSSFINLPWNYVGIAGNTMLQGIGFTSGAGVNINSANSTNELNGNVIKMRTGAFKALQTSGALVVNGAPWDPADYSGTVIFTGSSWDSVTNSMTAQTITMRRSVYTNLAGNITFTGLGNIVAGNYEQMGTATLFSNGADRTVVTPGSWHCSDFVSTRTLTNGNQMVLTAKVIPGLSTNVAIAQFK